MRYEYANEQGERRIIEQPMTEEHPAAVTFDDRGEWTPCDSHTPGAFVRVFGDFVPSTPDKSFGMGSAALPRNIDPKLCPDRDARGRPVVRNYAHAREIERATGFRLE